MLKTVTGTPNTLLRLEATMTLIASVTAYAHLGTSWWLFALLFLVPDMSIAGYAAGPRVGAATYNFMHWCGVPLVLTASGLTLGAMTTVAIGLIWMAHIAFDRMLGYGLKYAEGFKVTHLSRSAAGEPAAAALA
ncbi:DUF4260 domain-containing protein [Sphingomonas sp. PL-96]|uniref:DUF4260 domain-containing protein n=1 Tax=Sphingomonas sp. PL-96 TaxID=2887201 RepID=UPI001E3AFE25|nr:DUF4260 domain-containing protein [Sphingomonas sp. PL-96]MCC2976663.1 DUF4260 domain-containing protein [Sphingomonas sp. PL-96]